MNNYNKFSIVYSFLMAELLCTIIKTRISKIFKRGFCLMVCENIKQLLSTQNNYIHFDNKQYNLDQIGFT
jgi:hypothetical protein